MLAELIARSEESPAGLRWWDHGTNDQGLAQLYDRRNPLPLQYNETMGKWLAGLALAALATGCNYGAGAFQCERNDQCTGGRCEIDFGGFCSRPDPSCDSGRRFGDLSGDQSNQCVGGGSGQTPIDAAPDTPAPDATACFGTRLVQLCLDAAPTQAFTVDAATTLNTDSSPLCAHLQSGPNVCVVAATTIAINARLRATGIRPLVLLATTTITIPDAVDVGSHRGDAELGAGANSALCNPGTPPGVNGGGAGGSFTGTGGAGGSPNPGTPGAATATVAALRGGCAGQDGNGGNKGAKGNGGGAVYLIAGTSITVAGAINATGAGGGGGVNNSPGGGGGGGSGGMIGFDAPAVTLSGLLLASGGGGGEGSVTGQNGNPGADPLTTAPAPGGAGGANGGGSGGDGSAITIASPGSPGANAPTSGGGGGGGAGLIKVPANATLDGLQLSPLITPDA